MSEVIVLDWGDKVNSGIGLDTGLTSFIGYSGPVRQPYAGEDYIPRAVRDYEFGLIQYLYLIFTLIT
jgi:hypothetical protein